MGIVDFYTDRTIFITGATGFLGKVVCEKLLRSVPDLGQIFLLIRPQKGLSAEERLKKLIESRLFDRIRRQNPSVLDKLIPINGDLSEANLGLSQPDLNRICEEVSVVFHCAACIKFDEELRLSVELNVISLQQMIALCYKLQHLSAFVHTSTAYANCHLDEIEEKVYTPVIHPQRLIDALEWMNDDLLNSLVPHLIRDKPNTYTFTKGLAEFLLMEEAKLLPTVIVRPSIIGAAYKEPIPGWVDNWNGPTGLITAVGKGLLNSMMGDNKARADIIPVDLVSNMIICAAYHVAINRPEIVPVINCCTGTLQPCTWGELTVALETNFEKNPFEQIYGIPTPKFTTNRLSRNLRVALFHLLPAYVIDAVLLVLGKKPSMVRIYDKLLGAVKLLEFFTMRDWQFHSKNSIALWDSLSSEDQQLFPFDVRQISWDLYWERYCLGVKQFMLREKLTSMPLARGNFQRNFSLKILSRLLKATLYAVMLRVIAAKSVLLRRLWHLVYSSLMQLITSLTPPPLYLS